MNALLIYLLGWVILSIGYYIYHNVFNDEYRSKKLIAYRSFTIGFFSWAGIILYIAIVITGLIFSFDDWIVEKLK